VNKQISAGINGMGRFGIHLLRYWTLHYDIARFSIDYINDDGLSLEQLQRIVEQDSFLDIKDCLKFTHNSIVVDLPNGAKHKINYTNFPADSIPWSGSTDIFLECSGKNIQKTKHQRFLTNKTTHVLISATAPEADQTLIYGYNHASHNPHTSTTSYGSCTVNAYVPLANWLNEAFSVSESDVNVIHNMSKYQIQQAQTMIRKTCTLEASAPRLLNFITSRNFKVNYTLVPYTGVSIIDMRFKLSNAPGQIELLEKLRSAISSERALSGLYQIEETDKGPQHYKFSEYSAVIMAPSVQLKEDNLYIQAYFDNENSANRYFDIANHIIEADSHA
jgi:glyceraldehyde 3-phosphate dehydrogenase